MRHLVADIPNNDEWFYVLHLGVTPPKKKPAMRRASF
jgi:hypothetical protein